jgi:hypothetical protein
MNLYHENWLRNQADTPTIKILDLWHSLCCKEIGTSIEVMVGNRKDYPFYGINTAQGELNTAIPQTCKGKVVLALLLNSVKKLDMLIVTHELGHWVLKLQGLKSLANYDDRNGRTEVLLGSLASHSALYVLQRSLGHDPQKEVDRRASYDIGVLSRSAEPSDEQMRIQKALIYSDDLIHCSQSNRKGMQRILSTKHPNTDRLVKEILEIESLRDISKIMEISPFCLEIIQKLNLGQNWFELDEIDTMRTQLKSLNDSSISK